MSSIWTHILTLLLLLLHSTLARHLTRSENAAIIPTRLCSQRDPATGRCLEIKDCTHTPRTRACWSAGFSITTDFDTKWPLTGATRSYHLTITNGTAAPDGVERSPTFLINGRFRGPTIWAEWGDEVVVTVENQLRDNGTGIHWHGMRQWLTGFEDGVPGVTECPLAPGKTRTYRWRATQFGTSWYHSHVGPQYGDGVLGAIVINGPSTANYDEDLGPYTVSDWYYQTIAARSYLNTRTPGRAITEADNGLINNTMVSPDGTRGAYAITKMQRGKRYRLRLINVSVDNSFMVSLDGHPFEVITADLVPVKPVIRDWIFLGIGQRHDVIITANQTGGSWWFRAEAPNRCGANANNGNIKSIFRYENGTSELPTSKATEYKSMCGVDYPLVPFWDSFVPKEPLIAAGELQSSIMIGVRDRGPYVQWGLNFSAVSVDWETPVVQRVLRNQSVEFPRQRNLIRMPDAGNWYYWIIQEVEGTPITVNLPHPMHLHGHDFWILGSGHGDFSDVGIAALDFDNPTRRDTHILPAGGWLAVAFITDNPGAWLFHCHIVWHSSQGMAVQFLESVDQWDRIAQPASSLSEGCRNWNVYYPQNSVYLRAADESGV